MKTITVKGSGKVSVAPDLITVSMNLETRGREYGATVAEASGKLDLLYATLREVGLEKEEVKTSDFQVRTRFENVRTEEGCKNVFAGYSCVHRLTVGFALDTGRLAAVLSAVAACPVHPEFSVRFSVKDTDAVRRRLLKTVAENAREKAGTLCAASGVELGDLLSIDYAFDDGALLSPTGYGIEGRMMAKAAVLAAPDVTPEDIEIDDSATFVFEIR